MSVQESLKLGAWDLKKYANKNLATAFGISLMIHILLLGYPVLGGIIGDPSDTTAQFINTGPVTLEDFEEDLDAQEDEVDLEEYVPPPPPPMAVNQDVGTGAAERMANIVASDSPVDGPELADMTTMSNATALGGGDGGALTFDPANIDMPTERLQTAEKKVRNAAQEFPDFVPNATPPNYDQAELLANISYPQIALDNGIEGTVYIKVKIDKTGRVVGVSTVRSTNDIFKKAAEQAVKRTQFSPAIQNGYPVSMALTIPVKFQLRD